MKRTVKVSTKSCCMAKEAMTNIQSGPASSMIDGQRLGQRLNFNCFTSSAGTSTFLNEFNFSRSTRRNGDPFILEKNRGHKSGVQIAESGHSTLRCCQGQRVPPTPPLLRCQTQGYKSLTTPLVWVSTTNHSPLRQTMK